MNMESTHRAAQGEGTEASATQRTYLRLRRLIVTGELAPGEKLKIDALRQRLATGASPTREALSLLTADGLVERHDQRGFRTTPISRQNFEEILRLRNDLEDMALRLSVAKRTEAWEERLVLQHHRMSRAKSRNDEMFEELHKSFHVTLIENCDSPILLKFCSQLYDHNIRYRYIANRSKHYKKRDVSKEHEDIMRAAVEGDVASTSALLMAHYQKTGEYLAEFFETLSR
jgi:DNA-binding GntR family transcriptional regulator